MKATTPSDTIREYAVRHYIDPAKRRGETTVTIVAGDVHRALGLINRVPAVCAALSSKTFLEENSLTLEKREGPPSGLSTTVRFTYRLPMPSSASAPQAKSAFYAIRGLGKEVFRELGGGEAFLRRERERFYGPAEDPSREPNGR